MKKDKNILISFSGGRTSALMARMIQINDRYKDYQKLFVFANTGKEREETLHFVNECDKKWNLGVVWIEAKVINGKGNGTQYTVTNFENAKRSGEPFEAVIKKYGLPSKLYRHCTRELKEEPIHKFARSVFGGRNYVTAIGIRADEKHRLKSDPTKFYPLAELNVDEQFVREWWERQDFDLQLKDYEGNCDLCFLKSKRKKLTLISESPNVADWWKKIEDQYGSEKQPIFDVYRDLPIEKLIELSQQPFTKAVDKHDLRKMQVPMFEPDMDLEFDCFCKSS